MKVRTEYGGAFERRLRGMVHQDETQWDNGTVEREIETQESERLTIADVGTGQNRYVPMYYNPTYYMSVRNILAVCSNNGREARDRN